MKQLEKKILENAKINREYTFIVKADQKTIPVKDTDSKGNIVTYPSLITYLVPLVSDQSTAFFDAWLPAFAYDANGTILHHEVALRFTSPIYRTVRCGVCRKNKNYPDNHHLVLMNSESVEEILSKYIGKTFQISVLPDMEAESQIT